MLKRYQPAKTSFGLLRSFTFPAPYRSFSFIRLTKEMEVRRKMRYDIGEANYKVSQRAKPFYERIKDMLNNNKRKLAFFLVLCGLLNFFEGYKSFVSLTRILEPVKLQLKIWFLGEKHYIPESIEETFMSGEGIKLREETANKLSYLFVETDRELKYGINKKFLRRLYTKLNILKTKEERQDFYNDTLYSKKLNQRLNGVSLKQFLLLFQGMLKKQQYDGPNLSEEEFLRKTIETWDEVKADIKIWEDRVSRNSVESSKPMQASQGKQKVIKEILSQNPAITIEEFERQIVERGYKGLSLKEKIEILETQLFQLSSMKIGLRSSGYNSFLNENTQSLEQFREFGQKVDEVGRKLLILRKDFQRTLETSLKNGPLS